MTMSVVTERLFISSAAGLMEHPTKNSGFTPAIKTEINIKPSTDQTDRYFQNAALEAAEIADALDRYKLIHRRRFISFEEMIEILRSLGYRRSDSTLCNRKE